MYSIKKIEIDRNHKLKSTNKQPVTNKIKTDVYVSYPIEFQERETHWECRLPDIDLDPDPNPDRDPDHNTY